MAKESVDTISEADLMRETQAIDHHGARALIAAAATVLRGQLGDREMAIAVGEVIRQVLNATLGSGSSPGQPEPAPRQTPPVQPGMDVNGRAEVMAAFLRNCESAEGQQAALSSILASATFLRERNGEDYAVGMLRQVEGITSRAAALDRWWPGQGEAAQ